MPNFLGALPLTVGASHHRGRRGHHGGGHPGGHHPLTTAAMERANRTAAFARPDLPGSPARDGAMLPAAFPPFLFALAQGTNGVNQQMNPQTAFRGQRLYAFVIRNGTSAAVSIPLLQFLLVGMKPIIVTPSGVPLELYVAQSFDTNVILPPSEPGVLYSMTVALSSALTTTDTITAVTGAHGSAIL